MLHQNFNKDFANQFRGECELYSTVNEYQFGKMVIKIVKGPDTDIPVTGETLTEIFFSCRLIAQILNFIRNENLSSAKRLTGNVKALNYQLETYLKEEPYTAHYYNDRIAMLNSFTELIDTLRKDLGMHIYSMWSNNLKNLSAPAEYPAVESSFLSDAIIITEFYLKNIFSYYNYFLVTWQYESSNDKGIQLTTYMADHLQALIGYIEEMMTGLEATRSLLLDLEQRMETVNEQELYN